MTEFKNAREIVAAMWGRIWELHKIGEGLGPATARVTKDLGPSAISSYLTILADLTDQIPHRKELEELERISGKPILRDVVDALDLRKALEFRDTELDDGTPIRCTIWMRADSHLGPDEKRNAFVAVGVRPFDKRANIRDQSKAPLLWARKEHRNIWQRDIKQNKLRANKQGGVHLATKRIAEAAQTISEQWDIAKKHASKLIEKRLTKEIESDFEKRCHDLLSRPHVCLADILNWRIALDAEIWGLADYSPKFSAHQAKMMTQKTK
ncbi:hypothetical protein WDW37_11895 [Bdellovibrionota bacterium FG-1]